MKSTIIWIGGFLEGIASLLVGNAIMLIIAQVIFNHLKLEIASVLCFVISLALIYKIADFAFFIVPYVLIKVRTISLMYVFTFITVSSSITSLYFNDYFNTLSSIPKGMYLFMQVIFILAVLSLIRITKNFLVEKQIEEKIRREFE